MVAADASRSSGVEGAEVEAAKDADDALEVVTTTGRHDALTDGSTTQPEDVGTTPAPSFHRMRLDWQGPDAETLRQIHTAADQIIDFRFRDLLELVYNLEASVRNHLIDRTTGEALYEADGLPMWERNNTGGYVEDWSQLSREARDNALFGLATGMFRWETQAKMLRGEALFMKGKMTETFSIGFRSLSGTRPTVDDRTAEGRIRSAEDRYTAIFRTYLSDRAQGLISAANGLSQALRFGTNP